MSVLETALRDLGDELDRLDQYGREYAVLYAESVLEGRGTPNPVGKLHPCAAKLVREFVLDAAAADRRGLVAV